MPVTDFLLQNAKAYADEFEAKCTDEIRRAREKGLRQACVLIAAGDGPHDADPELARGVEFAVNRLAEQGLRAKVEHIVQTTVMGDERDRREFTKFARWIQIAL